MAGRNHSMRKKNKTINQADSAQNVLLWSKLWLWTKVSTLKVIMFVGRWECVRGVLWDFHSALGWILSLWIWWKTGEGRSVEWQTDYSCDQQDASFSLSLLLTLSPSLSVSLLFMNTSHTFIMLFLLPYSMGLTALFVCWAFLWISVCSGKEIAHLCGTNCIKFVLFFMKGVTYYRH